MKRFAFGIALACAMNPITEMPAQNGPGIGASSPIAANSIAADAGNALGLDLLRSGGSTSDNALLSPFSIESALAMTYAGADGDTFSEMARVLHFPKDEPAVHASFAALRQSLDAATARATTLARRGKRGETNGEPLTLTVANRLFGQQGYGFLPPFLAVVQDHYGAPLQELDFAGGWNAARDQINRWVEDQTHHRIQDLIPTDGVNRDTRLVLVNAIHLKAPWAEPFSESATEPGPFHLAAGNDEQVAMMTRQGRMGFEQRDGFVTVGIPYLGGDFQFLVLLPGKVDGLPALEGRLTPGMLKACAAQPAVEVRLHLPRFRMEPPLLRLGAELKKLGMKSAFDDPPGSAHFERMAPPGPLDRLRISEVFHKTFLELDEKGTEAAAATAVSMMRVTALAGPKAKPVEVRVDRPFLFAVQHRPSGACLFLGRLTDP